LAEQGGNGRIDVVRLFNTFSFSAWPPLSRRPTLAAVLTQNVPGVVDAPVEDRRRAWPRPPFHSGAAPCTGREVQVGAAA
jgi:hypothetical protein